MHQQPECIELLLEAMADLQRTSFGKRPIEVASGSTRCVALLQTAQAQASASADAAASALLAEEEEEAAASASASAKKKRSKKKKAKGGADGGVDGGADGGADSELAAAMEPVSIDDASGDGSRGTSASHVATSSPPPATSPLTSQPLPEVAMAASGARRPSDGPSPRELQCVICLDALKSRACVPCGHVCVCERCAAPLMTCPICREPCTDLLRIYLS